MACYTPTLCWLVTLAFLLGQVTFLFLNKGSDFWLIRCQCKLKTMVKRTVNQWTMTAAFFFYRVCTWKAWFTCVCRPKHNEHDDYYFLNVRKLVGVDISPKLVSGRAHRKAPHCYNTTGLWQNASPLWVERVHVTDQKASLSTSLWNQSSHPRLGPVMRCICGVSENAPSAQLSRKEG